ncbi:ergothioneine biosynthesis protein EgtB [Arundinibacter roseus]|uniref:Ergothioneine biosynthesis protein EgtB n=1 Tax=Arundinibacter roseus TaxID=2070510 RepID=A0A4R4KQ00_9BACT|nr:ergothioneine biosynthesis protein EgtB [Arundinibacter roseus]TDB68972.1 ergothioneine biosynthesis protein EgtB [Arundinibacter roseus]
MNYPTIVLTEDSPATSDITAEYEVVRRYSVDLCTPLQREDYIPQPVDFVSPPKWHLAHTTWFFEEFILVKNLPDYERFHPDFSYLFNSYYNHVGSRVVRTDRGNITRPGVEEVYTYRRYVDDAMRQLLATPVLPADLRELVVLGLNHEQQHQELLITDLKFILGHNPIFPVYKQGFSLLNQVNEKSGEVVIPEGLYDIGFEGEGFCYDNELARHKVFLEEFTIQNGLVTNGEYMEFMQDGGYRNFDLWLDEGWQWVTAQRAEAPLYWHWVDNRWQQYTLSGLQEVQPGQILCHINYYEAAAYASWKGMRLPTEFEWEIGSAHMPWGQRWEWTQSAYLPYPRFSKAPGAIGEYNGKFMINQMVLRGASSATSPGHSRATYRNFFHPHLQWQCTGIRLVR